LGVKCGRCIGLTTLPLSLSRLSRQCGILNISQPYRPPRPLTGIALLFIFYFLLLYNSYTFSQRNIKFLMYEYLQCISAVVILHSVLHIRPTIPLHFPAMNMEFAAPQHPRVHTGFVVDEVALGQIFSVYFCFSCQSSHLLPHSHHEPSSRAIPVWRRVRILPP
jgi:hypothetical protein